VHCRLLEERAGSLRVLSSRPSTGGARRAPSGGLAFNAAIAALPACDSSSSGAPAAAAMSPAAADVPRRASTGMHSGPARIARHQSLLSVAQVQDLQAALHDKSQRAHQVCDQKLLSPARVSAAARQGGSPDPNMSEEMMRRVSSAPQLPGRPQVSHDGSSELCRSESGLQGVNGSVFMSLARQPGGRSDALQYLIASTTRLGSEEPAKPAMTSSTAASGSSLNKSSSVASIPGRSAASMRDQLSGLGQLLGASYVGPPSARHLHSSTDQSLTGFTKMDGRSMQLGASKPAAKAKGAQVSRHASA